MNTILVKDMNVTINLNGCITGIIGPANSGKTTLAKRLCNKIDNRNVFIDDVSIKEYDFNFLRNNIAVCLDDNSFKCDHVAEELYFYLDKLGYRVDEITKKIDEISRYFKINKMLDKTIDTLNVNYKMLVKILSLLIIKPKVFVVDNLVGYLSKPQITLLFKYIKDNGISFINIISDSNLLLLCDEVVVMNDYKAAIYGPVSSVLGGNSILPYMGIKLPFAVDLSQNLILYNVVDKIYTDSGKLVNKIWK